MALTDKQITELLKLKPQGYPIPPQFGPLRWFETEMRCASRGCSSPTSLQLEGIPRCSVHAIRLMNEMLTSEEDKNDPQYEERAFKSNYKGRE